jgi:hypothetical protein
LVCDGLVCDGWVCDGWVGDGLVEVGWTAGGALEPWVSMADTSATTALAMSKPRKGATRAKRFCLVDK